MDQLVRLCLCADEVEAIVGSLTRDLSNAVQPALRFTPTQQQVGIERGHWALACQASQHNARGRLLITTIQLGEGLSCYKLMGWCKSVWNLLILIRTSQSDLTTHVCGDIILHGSEKKTCSKTRDFNISSAPLMGWASSSRLVGGCIVPPYH